MSEQESQSFDPYHRWLGIAPKDQPPNHYRLLGVDVFEQEADVIESAAVRQIRHLRSFQIGQNSELSQQLLNELSKAKICLLNSEKKAAYDAQLRAEMDSKSAASTFPPTPPLAVSSDSQSIETRPQLVTQAEQLLPPIASVPEPLSHSLAVAVKPVREPLGRRAKHPFWARPQVFLPAAAAIVGFIAVLATALNSRPTTNADDLAHQTTATHVESPGSDDDRLNEPPKNDAANVQTLSNNLQAPSPPSELPVVGTDVEMADQSHAVSSPQPNATPLIGQHILRLGEKGGIELANTKGMFRADRECTIELWARPDPHVKALNLVGDHVLGHPDVQDPDGGFLINLTTKDGKNYVGAVMFTTGGLGRFQLKPNDWQHFAVTSDTEYLRFFANGKLVLEKIADPNDWKPAPINLHIGHHPYLSWSIDYGFKADLRALRISSTCNYRDPFTPPGQLTKDQNTEVLLSFENPHGERIEDLSGEGHHGTITGGQWIPLTN